MLREVKLWTVAFQDQVLGPLH